VFLNFYNLKEHPFGVTPDPRFLYMSPHHGEALSSLVYGIESNLGFLALIAEPGMGKTTLLYNLMQRYKSTAHTAFVFQTQCNSQELIRFLLIEIGLENGAVHDPVTLQVEFNRYLLKQARAGRRFIVVIDEAQNLEPSVLETVRLLSDFETPQTKLLQIILAGQPQLAEKLATPELRQLRQRISMIARLAPLNATEVSRYIAHRLQVAGSERPGTFTPDAEALIAEISEGIPRNINNLCFNAMSLGYALSKEVIDVDVVHEVSTDLNVSDLVPEPPRKNVLTPFDSRSASPGVLPKSSDSMLTPVEALAYMREIVELLSAHRRIGN